MTYTKIYGTIAKKQLLYLRPGLEHWHTQVLSHCLYIYIYISKYIYIYNISIILSIYLLLTNKTLSEQIIPWNFKMKFCLNGGLVQKFLGKKLKTLTVFVCEITICWIVL